MVDLRPTALITLALLAGPTTVAAQHHGPHASIMAGAAEYDLSGVNTSPVYAVRAAVPLRRNVLMEGSFSYVPTAQQFGKSHLLLPEVQAQLQGTWGRFSPYLGLGGGVAIDLPEEDTGAEDEVDFAPSFSVGLRVTMAPGVGLRADGRLHGIGADFAGGVSELTAGFTFGW